MRNIKSVVRSLWLLRPLGRGQLQLCWSIRLNFLCLGSLPTFFRLNCQKTTTPTNYKENFPVLLQGEILYDLSWSWVHVLEFKLLVKSGLRISPCLSFNWGVSAMYENYNLSYEMYRLSQLLMDAGYDNCVSSPSHCFHISHL